ncbi:MAG: ABC transporter ATP-binding protein [Tissierellia bacterium]|nr:ABC transporter ATP-binding protein [Tissierellia bacterium]
MENIIEIKNLTKSFPGVVANDDISLEVKKGEIFALLGENGAGKSVLMSILFGMYEPDSGEIYIRGEKINEFSPQKSTIRGIGMVHQHFKLVENYTVWENITLGQEIVKKLGPFNFLDNKKSIEEVKALMEKFGLEVNVNALISDLTVAQMQRVEILKMLYRNAEILIFDEPTAVLAPQEIENLLATIVELKNSGKTIILVTHKLDEIKKVADRFAVLRRGSLIDVRDVENTSTKEMANLMVGRDIVIDTVKEEANFGKTVLEVKDLSLKNNLGVEKLKNINFSIREGEIFAIAGVDGNGQEEIAEAISGLNRGYTGEISLNGVDISRFTVRERNLEGMSFIPEDRQNTGLIVDFNIAENISLRDYYKDEYNKNGKMDKGHFIDRADDLIDKYDIRQGRGPQTIVRTMSGGNQQKVILAREIEENLPFIIFVQPTRGLDIGAIEKTREYILEERRKGRAILLISYELEEILALSDTIAVIYGGEILKISDSLTQTEIGEYMTGAKR